MISVLPFPNQIRDIMKKGKRNPRKSTHSTQFPNQTHNVDKNEMIEKLFVKCKQKCFSINKQSGKKNQSKTSNKSKTLGQTSTQIKIQRLYPCDKNQKKKTCKIYKERLSITENQSTTRFKLTNQSNTGIRSPPQETKEKLGEKIKIDSLQQILQESSQADSRAQCDELRSSQATNRSQCDVVALDCTGRVRRQRVIAG
jgi:hypothetical protein